MPCLTLHDSTNCTTPSSSVLHDLPEFAQLHVLWVNDAIRPSDSQLSPSPPAFKLSQHQGLFQWVSSSHHVANVLGLQLQYRSFQWIFRMYFLYNGLIWSPCSPRDSQESSLTPQPQFESINSSVLSFLLIPLSHPYMITGKNIALTRWKFVGKVMSLLFNMLPRLIITFKRRQWHST